MKLSQSLCVFVLGTILSNFSIAPSQSSSSHRIAHRYDDSRIIFAVASPDEEPQDFEKQGLLQDSSRLPAPVAKLTGMSLWEPNEAFLKRHREILDKVRVGDPWVIIIGGETTIHCKIEKFAVATMACQAGIAAICSVAPDEQ